jgi:hypothetical protein
VYDFSVPINTTATIQLETALPAAVRVNGNAASNARGEISTSIGKDSVQIVVGSGRYRIRAANPAEGHK